MIISLYRKLVFYKFIKRTLKVGSNTKILTNLFNFGSEPYLIEIGDNCLITSGVKFITHDGSISVIYNKFSGLPLKDVYGKYNKFGKIKVGNNCFIGINTIILPGVTIGDNTIIGAGSVITRDIPDNTVYAGNPAREICKLEDLQETVLNSSKIIYEKDREKRMREILEIFNKV